MRNENRFLVSITGPDGVGHIAQITGYLFETGCNLADTTFAVLGEGFEFSSLVSIETEIDSEELSKGLENCGIPESAQISVRSADFDFDRSEAGTITHIVEFSGGDRPGLVARMSEVFGKYSANIVRMTSRRSPVGNGYDYRTRFVINANEANIEALEAALVNTAGSLRLDCSVSEI